MAVHRRCKPIGRRTLFDVKGISGEGIRSSTSYPPQPATNRGLSWCAGMTRRSLRPFSKRLPVSIPSAFVCCGTATPERARQSFASANPGRVNVLHLGDAGLRTVGRRRKRSGGPFRGQLRCFWKAESAPEHSEWPPSRSACSGASGARCCIRGQLCSIRFQKVPNRPSQNYFKFLHARRGVGVLDVPNVSKIKGHI